MFPRTEVDGLSLSRIIIGTNWLLGWSHTGSAADKHITGHHNSKESMSKVLEEFLKQGIDTVMGPLSQHPIMVEAVNLACEKTGKGIIIVDTPRINVSSDSLSRTEAEKTIKNSADIGSKVCLIHHESAERLVNKGSKTIDRLPDYTAMIRENNMIPGLSAHMPELILYSDANEYDIQTYIQIYNADGFLMQMEIETIAKIIHEAKKPVMTIKPFAAGRVTPYVGLNFVWNTIRNCDMVTMGCFTPEEAFEDIEISRAAIERRLPNLPYFHTT